MFCPVCKAEYRPGFRECSDCGIDLVDVAPQVEERFHAIREAAPVEYDELLVRSKDPGFYLEFLGTLASCQIPCYGKAVNPVVRGPSFSSSVPEFEVWIPRTNVGRAAWIRDSFAEEYQRRRAFDMEQAEPEVEQDDPSQRKKTCALCSAESGSDSSLCENCGTTLYWSHERIPQGELARKLFYDAQPQILGELRTALLEQNIPFNNAALYRDGLLRLDSSASSTLVVVRDADFNRATELLARLLERFEFEPTSYRRVFVDPTALYWPHRADHSRWLPEDLTELAWTGHNFFRLDDAAGALREHEVPYRVEAENPKAAKLFVHPESVNRALEVLQDLEKGSDPG